MIERARAIGTVALSILAALSASTLPAPEAAAWDKEGVPADYEGPPWGSQRFQRVCIRAAIEYSAPVYGKSGGIAAPFAPDYSAGWLPGMGGFGEIELYFCPGYSISLAVERSAFKPSGPETVGGTTWEFGQVGFTSAALFIGIHMPFDLESELWRCTVAPATTGFVLYGKIGGGVALLDDLDVDTLPPPAVAALWWKSGPAGFASARIGIEYRLCRHFSVFAEAVCGSFLPQGGLDWPGAKEASAFVFAGGRAGIAILI